MNRRVLAVAALLALFLVGSFVGYSLDGILAARDLPRQEADIPTFVGILSFAVVGVLLVVRARGVLLGWVMLVIPTSAMFSLALVNYAIYALRVKPLPGMVPAAWVSSWAWFPTLILMFSFLPLLFPDARLPSRKWRWVAYVAGLGTIFMVASTALVPGDLDVPGGGIRNPVGIPGAEGVLGVAAGIGGALFVFAVVASAASLFVRFRRARGEERLQLKWFAYAVALNATLLILAEVFSHWGLFASDLLFGFQISLLPLSMAVAVLKYRLYDIDIIVNKTLVYAALTAVLVASYAGGVLIFRTILDPVTGESDIAIAASTLAVAALFGPARRKIQAFIDRRFYRSRYDAQQTLESFAARLRDEVELDSLSRELLGVVANTVHPQHVALWLPEER